MYKIDYRPTCRSVIYHERIKGMNTREKIIAHSFNLFLNKGYTSVKIKHILEELNLSRGGFYHHFHGKDEVLKEVVKKYYIDQMNDLTEIVESANDFKTIIQGIEQLAMQQIEISFEINKERPNHYYLMFEAMKLFPEMKEVISKWYIESIKKLKFFIEKAISSGELRENIEPSMLALQIITQIEGLFLMSYFVDKNINKEEVVNVFDKIYDNVKYPN